MVAGLDGKQRLASVSKTSVSEKEQQSEHRRCRVLVMRESRSGQIPEILVDAFVLEPAGRWLADQIRRHESKNRPGAVFLDAETSSRTVRLGGQSSRVILMASPSDVIAVESAGNYIQIHQSAKTQKVRELISAAEAKLAPFGFIRIHRSILINPDAIEQIERIVRGGYIVTMRGGRSFPVSRNHCHHLDRLLRSLSQPRLPPGHVQGDGCDPALSRT